MATSVIETDKLAFLHIPKTAGTSVHDVLASRFKPEEICPERFRELDSKPLAYLERYRFFSGHFTGSALPRISGKTFAFSILRNPHDRIVSLYYFWRRHSDKVIEAEDLPGARLARSVSGLKEFLSLDAPIPRNYIKNEMTRVLAGNIYTDRGDRYYELKNGKRLPVEKFEVLRRAMATLARLDHVMFVDSLDHDFEVLCRLIGLVPAPELPRRNTRQEVRPGLEAAEEEELAPEHTKLLNNLTDLDRLLYSAAAIRRNDLLRRSRQQLSRPAR